MSVKMIAHRGLSGNETENTLQSFVAAGNRTFYGIECDVHVTKDGKYVIFHDDNTGRLCVEDLVIEKTDFNTLRSLEFKDGVSRMPTLKEYLQVVSRYEKIAVIELKNAMPESNIREIIEICKEFYSLDKITFISFNFENLSTVRKILPKQRMQFLCENYNDGLREKLKENNFGIDIGWWQLTEDIVKDLHKSGVDVNCWTCDEPDKAELLKKWGVDYITTNILE